MAVLLPGVALRLGRRGVLLDSPRWLVHARSLMRVASLGLVLGSSVACEDGGELSRAAALRHADALVKVATADVSEVRRGVAQGVKKLESLWAKGEPLEENPEALREALETTRNSVQDLRVAKSTFFALAAPGGVVLRNDQEQDRMAGAPLFAPFPALARAVQGEYSEALGVMPEAAGVRGKPDGQWVAAQGVKVGEQVRALYVTGWAWSSYAYRLEFALRGQVTLELKDTRAKVPLLYVFVIVDRAVYSAPIAPEVNAQAIAALDPLSKLHQQDDFSAVLEITGRRFGLGAKLAPALGSTVAIAVLRSET